MSNCSLSLTLDYEVVKYQNMRRPLTKHRKTVLEVICDSCDHPTARQIFDRAVQRAPRLSFATVYNSLKYLTENGFLRQVSFGEDAIRYDAKLEPHDHIVCRKCHRIDDLFNVTPQIVGNSLPLPPGFKIEEISFQAVGLCQDCQ